MEGNDNKPEPIHCSAGCGFFGHENYNNMCSKCFKEKQKSERPLPSMSTTSSSPKHEPSKKSTTPEESLCGKRDRSPSESDPVSEEPVPHSNITSTAAVPVVEKTDKPEQSTRSRCFKCRLKIPLSKQTTNQCRCSYTFCDKHKFPDRHDCDVDHGQRDRDILAKNNPKLHERPRGGRSFQRIDSL